MLGKAHICVPPRLPEVSPDVGFETFSMFVLLRNIVQRFLFPRLSPPADRWCDLLGFVPGSVSSSSTLPRRKPLVIVVLSTWSFPFTPTHASLGFPSVLYAS